MSYRFCETRRSGILRFVEVDVFDTSENDLVIFEIIDKGGTTDRIELGEDVV